MKRNAWAYALPAIAMIGSAVSYSHCERIEHGDSLAEKIDRIEPVGTNPEIPCAEVAASRPLVLLALGQSNAGNHGAPATRTAEPITQFAEGKCVRATAPLPGGTGTQGSIWQRLPAVLAGQNKSPPVVLSILAVDATSIEDWTSLHSPLRVRLASQLSSMRRLGLAPNFILWQQGETDARKGTTTDAYSYGLDQLAAILDGAGSDAPIILARSTICKSAPSAAIRAAIAATVASDRRFRLGPDTDRLSDDTLRSGCHLTTAGLDRAALMWALAINTSASPSGHPP